MAIMFGTESEFLSTGSVFYISAAAFDVSKFVVVYADGSDFNRGAAKIGTVSGTTITFGEKTKFLPVGGATFNSVAILDASKFVVAYRNLNSSDQSAVRVGTVSGTTITFGDESEFLSTDIADHIFIATLNASKFVVVYRDAADSNHGTAKIGTVDGTTITFGDEAEFLIGNGLFWPSVAVFNSTKFVIAYRDGADSDHGTAKIGTVDGTTITFGDEAEFLSTGLADYISVSNFDASKFVVVYRDAADSNHGTAKIGTVDGTTITFGDEAEFLIGNGLFWPSVAVFNSTKFVIAYKDGADSGHGTAKIGTVDGTTITFDDEVEFLSTGTVGYTSVAILDASKFVVAYQDNADASHGTVKMGAFQVDSTIARPLDWLLRTHDYYPQIIGTFEILPSTVTIKVWDITDGQNTLLSLSDDSAYAIGGTGRWGWSTNNLPISNTNATHYAYTMYSNLDERFSGQFILDTREGSKWFHPRDRNDFTKSI